jgi:beta-aspartyl-peptidase (threonine type)
VKRAAAVFVSLLTIAIVANSLRAEDKPQADTAPTTKRLDFAIALHGGAGAAPDKMSPEERAAMEASLKQALTIGKNILEQGGTSLDAVEQVIRFLEDDPRFNAGRGAVFNSEGGHELDASIMDGRDKSCGAVAGVTTVKNPISLARLVMTRTRHVLLAAEGADRFAEEMGVDRVEQKYFWTQRRFDDWQRARKQEQDRAGQSDKHKGTVGCVALDKHENLAAGTSTGGLTNKKFGRVGDSPIVGAGTYADNATCAVSCTGIGEQFIRNAVAYDVAAQMAYQQRPLAEAVTSVIHHKLRAGDGGLIAVAHDGTIAMDFNTPGMARAAADSTGRFQIQLGK